MENVYAIFENFDLTRASKEPINTEEIKDLFLKITSIVTSKEITPTKEIIEWIKNFHLKYGDEEFNDVDEAMKIFELIKDITNKSQNYSRLSLFPLKPGEEKYFELYEKQEQQHWAVGEVSLEQDLKDWKDMSDDLKIMIERVMGLFNGLDRIILNNIGDIEDTLDDDELEKKAFYISQSNIEVVHMHMYSTFTETYITDTKRKLELFESVNKHPAVKATADWLRKYSPKNSSKAKLVAANAFGEGLFFSTGFAFALFLKTLGLMPGFCFANELIMSDENLHCMFAYTMYEDLKMLQEDEIYKMAKEAVEIQHNFVDFVLDGINIPRLEPQRIKDYATYMGDLVLDCLDYDPIGDIEENPLPWMELTAFKGKTNFFERRVGEYKGAASKEATVKVTLDIEKII